MVKICIIKPNKFNTQSDVCNLLFKDISGKGELMENVVKEMEMTPENVGDTHTIYEDESHIYQLCCVMSPEAVKSTMDEVLPDGLKKKSEAVPLTPMEPSINFNGYCSKLIKMPIDGTCVVFKFKLETADLADVTKEDMNNIINKTFTRMGIKMGVDTVEEFNYNSAPAPAECDTVKEYEYGGFKFVFSSVKSSSAEGTIKENTNATNFMKHFPKQKDSVFGEVLLTLKTEDGTYVDINKELFDKFCTVFGSVKMPLPSTTGIMNKYRVLDMKYKNIKNKSG